MKRILTVLFVCSVAFIACNGDEQAAEAKANDKYEQTKESLEETEKKSPKRFLSVEGNHKKKLFGRTVIKGTISNKATVAKFKDVDVELSYFSSTGALLLKEHEMIYKEIEPGNSLDFKAKTYAPKGTDSISMKIYAAKTE